MRNWTEISAKTERASAPARNDIERCGRLPALAEFGAGAQSHRLRARSDRSADCEAIRGARRPGLPDRTRGRRSVLRRVPGLPPLAPAWAARIFRSDRIHSPEFRPL